MSDPLQLSPGVLFSGRYRIDRLLKSGGMGAVYVAVHTETGRRVALKVMRPEIVRDEESRVRFAQEARVGAMIESANVVDVLDAGVDQETSIPFLVMELLNGRELGELLRERGRLPPSEVVDYIAQTAKALARAHAAGIVHRDLKPENLFLAHKPDEHPRIKILDFGIAKLILNVGTQSTHTGGTPLYMAPEQTRRTAKFGAYTDIWALGLIAYTLLVGAHYWLAEDIHQLYGEILSGEYASPSARAAARGVMLPRSFDAWFFRCVCFDPTARYQHARDASDALAEAFDISVTPRSDERSAQLPLQTVPSPSQWSGATATTPFKDAGSQPGAAAASPIVPRGGLANVSSSAPTLAVASTSGGSRRIPKAAIGGGVLGALVIGVVVVVAFLKRSAEPKTDSAIAAGAQPGDVASISLGLSSTSCVVRRSGEVMCWGTGAIDTATSRPTRLQIDGPVTQIALGKKHGCALMRDATVQCFGDNSHGQLGDGTTINHPPTAVPGLTNVAQIAAGIHHSCALLKSGVVKCWGGNKYGQLGDGTRIDRLTAAPAVGLTDVAEIAFGSDHGCALGKDGSVRCWGRNGDGEAGDGTNEDKLVSVRVELAPATHLSLGDHLSCALLADATVQCWGDDRHGALGDGAQSSRSVPQPVPGLSKVTTLTMGTWHGCARTEDKRLHCWGLNQSGQVGDNTTTDRLFPVTLVGSFGENVAAGREHTCAARLDSTIVCWGRNDVGQLGDGTTTNRVTAVEPKW